MTKLIRPSWWPAAVRKADREYQDHSEHRGWNGYVVVAPEAALPDTMTTGVVEESTWRGAIEHGRPLPRYETAAQAGFIGAVVGLAVGLFGVSEAIGIPGAGTEPGLWLLALVGGLVGVSGSFAVSVAAPRLRRRTFYLGVGHGYLKPSDIRRVRQLPAKSIPVSPAIPPDGWRPSRAHRLALIAIKTTEEIASTKAYSSTLVDHAQVRVTVAGEVRELVWRLDELHQTREQLGRDHGQSVIKDRHRLLDQAEKSLAERVATLCELRGTFDALSEQLRDVERLEAAEQLDTGIYEVLAATGGDQHAVEELRNLGQHTQAAVTAVRATLTDIVQQMTALTPTTESPGGILAELYDTPERVRPDTVEAGDLVFVEDGDGDGVWATVEYHAEPDLFDEDIISIAYRAADGSEGVIERGPDQEIRARRRRVGFSRP